ncbi:MAG: hypothetical protein IJX44_04585 [Bacteroidaceae bacterium]|nr:hypothetical protein [Bacteroidaceae bacterium]
MQVKINLNNPPTADKINVDLQWCVQVTSPKGGLFAKLFRKHNRVSRDVRITVSDIIVPQDIVCDKNNLFSILYGDKLYSQSEFPVEAHINDMAQPFQLLFHQAEIKDCIKPQDENPRYYSIHFTVNLIDLKGKVIDSVKEKIEIVFDPLGVKPYFAFDIDNEEIQYSASLKKEKIGVFAAWLDEEFKFTPEQIASVSLKLYQGRNELPGLISLGEENLSKIQIKAGKRNVVKLPIMVDFTTIPNPITEEEDYTIEALIVLSASYSPEVKETILKQSHFRLLKDLQGTELRVSMQIPEREPILCDNERSFPAIPMSFVPRSRLMGQVDVILQNIATDNSNQESGLYIKNLSLTEELVGDITVLGENNSILDRFITIDGAGVEAMNTSEGLFIPNGPNAHSIIRVSFNPSGIVDLLNCKSYNFKIQSTLTFDYWEDQDGIEHFNEEFRRKKSIPIVWQLHLEPNPEWLCVDYGSSAIVCRYDNEILDLKKQKASIYRKAEDGKFRLDTIEGKTPFLSSDIVFHTVRDTSKTTLCSQQSKDDDTSYLNLSVCLSPTSSLIKNDVRTQLPCLKILVGNEFLPPKPDFLTFRYARKNSNGLVETIQAKDAMSRDENSCILRISSIFNEAYSALFRYFILPESKDRSINKLVLTYPNTYTPAHLKVLEKIALETFPKVRNGYLRFVSESDAVSAYYLQNWDSFNNGRNISVDETVLVYDMGAGTLDITLFSKRLNEEGKIEVNILGKIGTGKAGNYLDYVISEIINERVEGAIRGAKTVSTASVPDVQTLNERLDIKQTVKDNIKPVLKPDVELSCGARKFNSSVILEDERFKDFLNQVTFGIISQLLSYIGDSNLKIDTVLMSGRSCRLETLQKALQNSLNKTGFQEARIVKFESNGNKEKTVVVEGAMARAALFSSPESPVLIRSRRLYASYGLIYQRLGGTYEYTELLKSSDLPFISDNTNLDDYEGNNVSVTGTAAAGTIKLIQTYLSPEDTEIAYNRGDLEFISEMEEYDMADFGGRDQLNVKLKLDYKNNISLYVNGRRSIGSSPKGVDLSSEITKRSIWPVTI